MKKLTAIYKTAKNAPMTDLVKEYKTKAQFTEDLRGNGFRVLAVLTDEEIQAYKEMSETEAILKRGSAESVREYCLQVL